MKKAFPTIVHASAQECESIIFSGGKIGYQVELRPADLEKTVKLRYADVVADV